MPYPRRSRREKKRPEPLTPYRSTEIKYRWMKLGVFKALVCILTTCVVGAAWSSGADRGRIETAPMRATKSADASASGVVHEIDQANSRIKIDHGPIPSIGMPAMTMTFKAKNPALLDHVEIGDQVNFEIQQSGLGWIITNLKRK